MYANVWEEEEAAGMLVKTGRLILTDGKLRAFPPENKTLQTMMRVPIYVLPDGHIDPKTDPEKFLRNLSYAHTSAYLQVETVREDIEMAHDELDLPPIEKAFDPNQPRDESGQWTSGGGGGGKEESVSREDREPPKFEFQGKPARPNGGDTKDQYRDEKGAWTKERRALHDKIVAWHLEGVTKVDAPVAHVMGGGTAAGKSHITKGGDLDLPKNIAWIDPDKIKLMLPEYHERASKGDLSAAGFTHEESSYISRRVMSEASKKGFNLLLDGTGDNGIHKLELKISIMRRGGQPIEAHYVTCPTEVALAGAIERAERTKRYVNENFVRTSHAGVSKVLPLAIERGLFDKTDVWDTTERGGKAVKIMSAEKNKMTVHDQKRWKTFLAKAKELG